MSDFFKLVFGAMAGPIFIALFVFLMYQALTLFNVNFGPVASVMIALTPIWLPIALFFITFQRWMWYVNLKFEMYTGRSTLRIHLPQEVFKSPEAMEGVLAQIHNVNSPDNLMQTYIDGKTPLAFSLELVSIGGEVRFYINVPTKKTKNAVEAQLYAYYPGIEVTEETFDYTDEITWDPDKYEYMSFHMGKTNDKQDFLPLKTYIDFGHDKIPKEEEKFEPMAAMLEQLSKFKPHERLWIQFIITPHVKRAIKNGSLYEIPTWNTRAEAWIKEKLKRDVKTGLDEETQERAPMLTPGERETMTAVERNVGKYAYEVGIRWIYITEKGKFDGDAISPTIRSFAQYDVVGRNGVGVRWRTDFDYKFISDRSGRRQLAMKRQELYDYKNRYYEHRDKKYRKDLTTVWSVEELATMYHIPGTSVVTPGLPRILSTRKEAPPNLPTGLARTI